jgi:glycosyltransferase involved in cell wall biosynthesis
MQSSRPLLTIAIPTYNRSKFLAELLSCLEIELIGQTLVELLIVDNASPDDTQQVVDEFARRGLAMQYVRNVTNVGPDKNFERCFEMALGRHFLLFGDDDCLVPGALAKIVSLLKTHDPDIMYLSSYSFSIDARAEFKGDSLGRSYRVLTDPLQFARLVNVMLTFISGIVVNRDHFMELDHEPIACFADTNLVQLGWTLPLLKGPRTLICVWERLIAGRINNSGGYNIAEIFGVKLKNVAERLLPSEPRIVKALSNAGLRRWFPGAVVDLRFKGAPVNEIYEIKSLLRGQHGNNPRLYVFVYPVLRTPLKFANWWVGLTRAVNKLIYVMYLPDFWRK